MAHPWKLFIFYRALLWNILFTFSAAFDGAAEKVNFVFWKNLVYSGDTTKIVLPDVLRERFIVILLSLILVIVWWTNKNQQAAAAEEEMYRISRFSTFSRTYCCYFDLSCCV